MPDRLLDTLGVRLREERQRRSVSLRKLAAASGLSTTTVHQIESGRGSPSLATLQALAATLGVPLGSLLEPRATPGTPAILLPAARRQKARIAGGVLASLAGGLPGQRVHAVVVTLAPDTGMAAEAITHPGHELVYALAGRVAYEVGDRRYQLSPGDSLVLDSRQPHRALNAGREPAELLLALDAGERAPAWLKRHQRPARGKVGFPGTR
jgi:transcriptional regulator with XRE-family HTH domain